MAISIITWAGNALSGSAGSAVVADDSAMQAGDVRYVAISISNQTISTPAGWALLGGAPLIIASTRRIYVFRRVHEGDDEPATTTFTFSAAANHSLQTWAARGADTTTPEDVVLAADSATSGTAVAAPSRTIATNGAVLISLHYVIANGSGITLSVPSGMTSIATGAGTGSAGHAYRVAYETETTGPSGARTSTSSTSTVWGAAAFAIRPLAAQLISPASIPSAEAFGTPSVGQRFWAADAENIDFSAFANTGPGTGGIDYLPPQARAIVTDPVRAGSYAYEHAVNGIASNGSQRCESRALSINFGEGDDRWFALSTYLPPGFPTSPGSWQLIFQLKNSGSGSPPLALHVEGGDFELQGGHGHPSGPTGMPARDLGPAVTGVWDDWLIHVLFSSDPAVGYVEIWRGGSQVLTSYKPPGGTLYPSQTSYPKYGLYRDPALTYGAATRVYHDELRIGSIRAVTELLAGTYLAPASIPSAETFGTPDVIGGDITIAPASIPSEEAVGTPGLRYDQTIAFDALLHPGADVHPGTSTYPGTSAGDGIPSEESVGQPTVSVLVDITRIPRSTARRRTLHELWCVARIPQQTGPPALIPVDPIDWSALLWTEELSRPETLQATAAISSLPESIRERVRHPTSLPSELWLYRDGELVCAGPWVTSTPTGSDVRITGWGLLGYLRYRIISHAPFVQVDQALIVKSLIDSTQARPFGHFGLDTSAITPTGMPRDITYRLLDRNILGTRIEELGRRLNGFDIDADPATRQVRIHHPSKGIDRSTGDAAIVFDARNITDPTASISTAPGDIASLVTAVGTSDRDPVYGFAEDPELASKWGLADHLEIFDGVSAQSTIDAHAAAARDTRRGPLVIPGPDIRIDDDIDLSRWAVGDTVEHQVHAELGIRGAYRVRKRTITVAPDGTETLTPEFG